MTPGQILFAVLSGLAVNECCELSPWCARKLVRWSAHCRYTDAARADARAEELTALIDDRPGKLFKLITALGFAAGAVMASVRRTAMWRATASGEQLASKRTRGLISTDDDLAAFLIGMWAMRSGRSLPQGVRPNQLSEQELIGFWADDLSPNAVVI